VSTGRLEDPPAYLVAWRGLSSTTWWGVDGTDEIDYTDDIVYVSHAEVVHEAA
jgi:hypothetical protein